MNNVLAEPPKYFRAPISRGGQPRVEREGGYRKAGIIHSVSIITKGEALGHDLWIDDVTLEQVADLISANRNGVKSRFTHPSMSGDGLGKQVGRVMDAEVEGNQVLADQHFLASAHKAPDGDLAEYLMSLADEDPTSYGLSIAFLHDADAMEQFQVQHTADGEFRSPDPLNVNHYPHVRIAELHAADAVDEPAANPNGLFHREHDIASQADTLAAYALGITNTSPETQLGLDPDRVRGFVSRFLNNHQLEVTKMAEQTAEAMAEPTPQGIQVGDRVKVKPGSEHDASHAGMVGTVGEQSTPALGIRFDAEPETVHRWYTAEELEPATDEAPATETTETPETQASSQSEAARFRAAFGDKGAVWFAEGLNFEQCRDREVAEIKKENDELKKQLSARRADGEETPVSFDTGEKAHFASRIRVR